MEEKKTPLTDALVKAAAWTHNTSVNKLGFSPLQLVTGKAVTLPGLTTGNEASESMTDSEAVQRTIENLTRTVSEFREADMRKKLKECQGHRTMSYQHLGEYVEGDKVWYQPMNGNAWLGPAAVLCQRGTSVWLHSQGDIKKVASCRVTVMSLETVMSLVTVTGRSTLCWRTVSRTWICFMLNWRKTLLVQNI